MTRHQLFALTLATALTSACQTHQAPSAAPDAVAPASGVNAATQDEAPATSAPERAPASGAVSSAIADAVSAPDRSDADRTLDSQRRPQEMLTFFQIAPGQRVAELAAGGGYTAELLARVVGSEGKVYGQNNAFILTRFAEGPWSERLKGQAMAKVVRVDRELESPLPADAQDLDAVLMVLFYHDTVWFKTDRAKMNQAVFAALRPGGIFGIVDHSAKDGDGVTQTKTLHRIEESALVAEIVAAGFKLEESASFLRNPEDKRDWNASPSQAGERRGQSDRFVLRFRKPAEKDPSAGQAPLATSDGPVTTCQEPRRQACTREYRPVCATIDTGVRCTQAPCPSTKTQTFSNGCEACAQADVLSHQPGTCPKAEPK